MVVSGENQKARLPQPYQPRNDTTAGWSDLAKSHAVPDTKPFQLDALLTDPTPAAKAMTLKTADLIAAHGATTKPNQFFHDLSVSSLGLLTNTATGGWRKDMSLMTENWSSLPASGLPFFRINSTSDYSSTTAVTKPIPGATGDPRTPQSIFYPWSAYPDSLTGYTQAQHGAVTSWQNLVEYVTDYKIIGASTDGNGHGEAAHRTAIPNDHERSRQGKCRLSRELDLSHPRPGKRLPDL